MKRLCPLRYRAAGRAVTVKDERLLLSPAQRTDGRTGRQADRRTEAAAVWAAD